MHSAVPVKETDPCTTGLPSHGADGSEHGESDVGLGR